MKSILLFGAGKSATVLIEYLKKVSALNHWHVTVADANLTVAQEKVGQHDWVKAVSIQIELEAERQQLIQQADVVISMLPPALHFLVAKDCLALKKHLLTASYVDDNMKQLAAEIQQQGLLFLCEMGLDPGIDHMSAMKMIAEIEKIGGTITAFYSHCGGLVAPESDNNAWHYKISWNPRNVVMAGSAGAVYKENNKIVEIDYKTLFSNCTPLKSATLPGLCYYPNRDSLQYMQQYGLSNVATFKRTTIRYTDYCNGWQWLVKANLTSEALQYDTDGLSFAAFFETHFSKTNQQQLYQHITHLPEMQALLQDIGWFDTKTFINKGVCSAAVALQFILENKWAMQPNDKDMVLMIHEIEYLLSGKNMLHKAELKVIGENAMHTAMAKTVGLPLGIAASLLLKGELLLTGLHIPTHPHIYNLVLPLLEKEGVCFNTSTQSV